MRRVLAGLLWLFLPAPALAAQELVLSVAISTREVVEELGRQFQAARPGVVLRYNLAGSGILQQQIEAGAPADLFLSAGSREMDGLEAKGLLLAGSRRIVARNRLAVVVPAGSALPLAAPGDLRGPGIGRVALGNPKTVPAGRYAEASLRALGLWEALAGRLLLGENVRQVLEYVARGEVEAGLVYATDAAARGAAVRTALLLPGESHPPIRYPAAVTAASRHPGLGGAFLDLLMSPQGQAAFARRGFQPAAGAAP